MTYFTGFILILFAIIIKRLTPSQSKKNIVLIANAFWGILLVGYAINEQYFVPLSATTLFFILAFLFFFSMTYILIARSGRVVFSFGTGFIESKYIYWFAGMINIISICFGIILLYNNHFSLKVMREGILDGSVSGFGLGISLPLSFCCMYLARHENKKNYFYCFTLFSFLLAVLSTSKIFLILFLVYIVGINSYVSKKKLLIYGTFVFGLFALSSIILGKFSSDPEGKIISAIFDTLRVYLFSGLAAFNLYVEKNVTLPENLLLYPFKEVWGTTKDIPKTDILPWINTGVWDTNVYTAFAPWYQSLGLYAAIIIGILLGFYYGIWFSFRQNLAVGFYQTFLCFPLLMLFFQEHYLLSWKMHFISFLCAILLAMRKALEYE